MNVLHMSLTEWPGWTGTAVFVSSYSAHEVRQSRSLCGPLWINSAPVAGTGLLLRRTPM